MMMNNMIDPSDLSVSTIEYLFSQQIMRLTAATVIGNNLNIRIKKDYR